MWAFLKEYLYQNFVGFDQWANTRFNGSADETLSSRCYRTRFIPAYNRLRILIDILFFPFQGWNHCEKAYIKDVQGRHLPHMFFEDAIRMNIAFDRNKLGVLVELIPK
ncbi:MAG TPA: hypothetical protein VFS89_03795 [Nitrosospira sp.]|nr:hypothetical protein [Nitrosospira sp.]